MNQESGKRERESAERTKEQLRQSIKTATKQIAELKRLGEAVKTAPAQIAELKKLQQAASTAPGQIADLERLREAILTVRKDLDSAIKDACGVVNAKALKKWLTEQSKCRAHQQRLGAVAEWASGRHLESEGALEHKFAGCGVKFIVSRSSDLGPVAARTFAHYVSERAAGTPDDGEKLFIGLSGGRTLFRMAECVSEPFHRLVLFPLAGVGLREDVHTSVNTVVHELAGNLVQLGASLECTALWVDTLVWLGLADEGRADLVQELDRHVLQMSLAFTGIGALELNRDDMLPRIVDNESVRAKLRKIYPTPEPIPHFKTIKDENELCADVLSRPINARGEVVSSKWIDKAVFGAWPSMPPREQRLDQPRLDKARTRARNPAKVVAIAGGERKSRAIAAVCRGRLVDVLVTDMAAARGILELANPSEKSKKKRAKRSRSKRTSR